MKTICLLPLFLLLSSFLQVYGQETPTKRFLVTADPQFEIQSDGKWKYTSNAWQHLPRLMETTGANDLFICGDLFGGGKGDGSTLEACWDEWDRYIATFDNPEKVHWVLGGHEFYPRDDGLAPKAYYLERYKNPSPRRAIRKDDVLFILMDNMHSPTFFDDQGLDWLEKTLEENDDARHTFVFHHVGPRNTLNWWNDAGLPPEKIPNRLHGDEWREKYAAILEKHKVTAAFSGHDHSAKYLGDRGGFDMFAIGVRFPMLVEVSSDKVEYSWILQPASAQPLSSQQSFEKNDLLKIDNWQYAEIRGDLPEPETIRQIKVGNLEKSIQHKTFKSLPYSHGDDGMIIPSFPDTLSGPVILKASLRHKSGWSGISALIRIGGNAVEENTKEDMLAHLFVEGKWQGTYAQSNSTYHAVLLPRTQDKTIEIFLLLTAPQKTTLDLRGHSLPNILEKAQQK